MTPFIGQIQTFAFNFAPRDWADCDGQLLQISLNTALFSLIGTIYGGDGRTTFALPDLRGRAAIHLGQGPGLSNRPQGQVSGQETTILTAANLPAHTHPQLASGAPGTTPDPTNNVLGNAGFLDNDFNDGSSGLVTMGNTGNNTGGASQSFSNMPPYLVIRYCIALVGIFPSRN